MRRIVVETETANKFIEDIEALAAKNNLDIELNMNELEVYVGFAPLLKAEIADIDMPEVPARPKGRGGRTKEPKVKLVVQDFKDALKKLDKGTLAQNITEAIDITGLSKSFLNRLYYCEGETTMVTKSYHEKLKPLLEPNSLKPVKLTRLNDNMIMIRRVARTKNTDDPYLIANTIIGSINMQKQTTFKNVSDVIEFIKKNGTR